MRDIIKGVVYDRGSNTLKGVTKHFSLIAMVIATDEPLVTQDYPEYIVMGQCSISDEFSKLTKYECPHKFGDISHAIIEASGMSPEELDEI